MWKISHGRPVARCGILLPTAQTELIRMLSSAGKLVISDGEFISQSVKLVRLVGSCSLELFSANSANIPQIEISQ